jgi:hypothetical protein
MGKVNAHQPRLNGIFPLRSFIIKPVNARKSQTKAHPQTIRPIRRLAEAHIWAFVEDINVAYVD